MDHSLTHSLLAEPVAHTPVGQFVVGVGVCVCDDPARTRTLQVSEGADQDGDSCYHCCRLCC